MLLTAHTVHGFIHWTILPQSQFSPNRKEYEFVKRYLHWTFRASFLEIIITDFIAFFLICLFWTCCIYVGALHRPRCFVVAGTYFFLYLFIFCFLCVCSPGSFLALISPQELAWTRLRTFGSIFTLPMPSNSLGQLLALWYVTRNDCVFSLYE